MLRKKHVLLLQWKTSAFVTDYQLEKRVRKRSLQKVVGHLKQNIMATKTREKENREEKQNIDNVTPLGVNSTFYPKINKM